MNILGDLALIKHINNYLKKHGEIGVADRRWSIAEILLFSSIFQDTKVVTLRQANKNRYKANNRNFFYIFLFIFFVVIHINRLLFRGFLLFLRTIIVIPFLFFFRSLIGIPFFINMCSNSLQLTQ